MQGESARNSPAVGDLRAHPGSKLTRSIDSQAKAFMTLSMVCFIEELEPHDMPLSPRLRGAVVEELQHLIEQPVLEALLLCLSRLSEGA